MLRVISGIVSLFFGLVVVGACSSANSDAGGSGGSGVGGAGAGGTSGSGGSGGLALGGSGGSAGGAPDAGGCNQAIDIVFVMDVSTSMGPFLSKLANEIQAVDTAVKALNLTVTPHYGLVVFVDDTTFANSAKPYADVTTLATDFKTWASFTSSNQQTSGGGTNSTWPENSLDALYRAAAEFDWRPAASTLRIVIHTTDDTFWQGPTTQDGVQILHDYQGTVSALQGAEVRVFSFASKLGGPFENEDVSAGWFGPYQGMTSLPDATGGGVYELDGVLNGSISLSAAIPAAVKDTLCKPYPTPK
jgi:hypothetical protein